MPEFAVVIPARFGSERLPGKPLLEIAGKPLIQHVWQRARESDATEVVIATDDRRIVAAAEAFGATVCMTAREHQSGTDRIAEANVPVVLTRVHTLPQRRWEPYDMPFVAANKLHEAGIPFAIAGDRASNVRNMPFEAATAASFGLPREAALRSVTLSPAEILGVADRVGSLDAGKDATFMVTDGDPLEIMTRIERVWIGGAEIDLAEDPQYRLYRKYDERPKRGED